MISSSVTEHRSPAKFFGLVFALSTLLWLLGAFTSDQLLPGLPVSSLMAFCPLIAAAILINSASNTQRVTQLLRRAFDFGRIKAKIWYFPILLIMPAIAVLAYIIMRLLQFPLPSPQFFIMSIPVMFLMFFAAALGEELGWTGYIIDPLQNRWNAL